MTALVIELRPGQRLQVGQAAIELQHKSGQVARIRITAPAEVKVERSDSQQDAGAAGDVRSNHAEIVGGDQ